MAKSSPNRHIAPELAPEEVRKQKAVWEKQLWSVPELRGNKSIWLDLIKNLMTLIADGQAADLNAFPNMRTAWRPKPWRFYARFLSCIGLVEIQKDELRFTPSGIAFMQEWSKRILADLLQANIKLFGEIVSFLAASPATIAEINQHFCKAYELNWSDLGNIRNRLNWLEILEMVEKVGNRKYAATAAGRDALRDWRLVSPEALSASGLGPSEAALPETPKEIAELLARLRESPEQHEKRSARSIYVPGTDHIRDLRSIVQFASDCVTREDLYQFVTRQFGTKPSSVDSLLPFLKSAGLLDEVRLYTYQATPAAKAWLGTGSDLDLIRILHAKMRFVGEIIPACKGELSRRELYNLALRYGSRGNRTIWIVQFLIEAKLLEKTKYLCVKATPLGILFASSLPLAEAGADEGADDSAPPERKSASALPVIANGELSQIAKRLHRTSRDPGAEGKAPGTAFEEAIADIFRFMGFKSDRIGKPGDTDVIVRWKEDSGQAITAIIDGKSKTNGMISHSDISDVAIDAHKDKNGASFVAIIGPGFSGDTIRNHARKKAIALITDAQLIGVAQASQELGLSLQEIAYIFHVPDGLSRLEKLIASKRRELQLATIAIQVFRNEEEALGMLSPRDLFLLKRDIPLLPSQKEFIDVIRTLSQVGILKAASDSLSPENVAYSMRDARRVIGRLRALASAIEEGLRC